MYNTVYIFIFIFLSLISYPQRERPQNDVRWDVDDPPFLLLLLVSTSTSTDPDDDDDFTSSLIVRVVVINYNPSVATLYITSINGCVSFIILFQGFSFFLSSSYHHLDGTYSRPLYGIHCGNSP
jgi:hypothetical protein